MATQLKLLFRPEIRPRGISLIFTVLITVTATLAAGNLKQYTLRRKMLIYSKLGLRIADTSINFVNPPLFAFGRILSRFATEIISFQFPSP